MVACVLQVSRNITYGGLREGRVREGRMEEVKEIIVIAEKRKWRTIGRKAVPACLKGQKL